MLNFEYRATYSAEDNKLRIYPMDEGGRMDADLYKECRDAGYKWAPLQKLFVAPQWTPKAEDFALKVSGEIDAEETTLAERAEIKAARLDGYAARREADAIGFFAAAQRLSERFYGGQPILIGHHSERSARRDQKRMDSAMRNCVTNAKKVDYWNYRAEGVERHANRKNSDGVRGRRIKRLLSELRDFQRRINEANKWLNTLYDLDAQEPSAERDAKITAFAGMGGWCRYGDWSAIQSGEKTPNEVLQSAIDLCERRANSQHTSRWIIHTLNRLGFERMMLGVVSRYEGELTPVIIQAFAREYGAEKPKVKKTEKGFLLSSPVTLPAHIGDGDNLELTVVEWVDMMAELGYEVPAEKPKKPPILNFKANTVEVVRSSFTPKEVLKQVEMTKAEYSKIHADLRGTRLSTCGTFRVKVAYIGRGYSAPLCCVFLTDSKAHEVPESDSVNAELAEA